MKSPVHGTDLRGLGSLAIDATLGITDVVEAMHRGIARIPGTRIDPLQQRNAGISGLVYRSIRGVTRLVGGGVDRALSRVEPLLDASDSPRRDAVLSAINGVLGDHLEHSANPLAISMQLRHRGRTLAINSAALKADIPDAGGRVLLLLHGLCMNDRQWLRNGHDHGAALARDLGYTPVYLRYNSGRPIADNAADLSAMLEALVREWPVEIEELAILGHSMGGLLARSACRQAAVDDREWLQHLRRIVFLGTPHAGAPLERGGSRIDALLGASGYTEALARIGKIRSAGITDLRHGTVHDSDQANAPSDGYSQRIGLPEGINCFAIAASLSAPGTATSRLFGDGLVPVASALGRHADRTRALQFSRSQRWIGHRMGHLDLLDRADAYRRIRRWLA